MKLKCMVAAVSLLMATATWADAPVIRATGTAIAVATPDRIRMQVELQADGTSMEASFASLKSQQETLKKTLDGMQPAKQTFSTPALPLTSFASSDTRIRGGMSTNRMTGPTTHLSMTVTADWPLKVHATPEEVLAMEGSLRDKLRGAAQSEDAEEASTTSPATAARFQYVAALKSVDRIKAIADATAKAKARATDAATALAGKLGNAVDLTVSIRLEARQRPGVLNMPQVVMRQEDVPGEVDDESDIVGSDPFRVPVKITVAAAFALNS